jgi:dienelactone hydrolase
MRLQSLLLVAFFAGIAIEASAAGTTLPGTWDLDGRMREADRPQFSRGDDSVAFTVYEARECGDRHVRPAVVVARDSRPGIHHELLEGMASWRFAWAPDASRLAFYLQDCRKAAPVALGLYDVSTNTLRQIDVIGLDEDAGPPQWMPDGQSVVVSTQTSEPSVAPGHAPVMEWRSRRADAPLGGTHAYLAGEELDSASTVSRPSWALVSVPWTGTPRVITRGVPTLEGMQSVRISSTGKWATYLSRDRWNRENPAHLRLVVDVALVDLQTGLATVLCEGSEIKNGLVEEGHNASLIWHPERDLLVLVHQGSLWRWAPGRGLERFAAEIAGAVYPNLLGLFADRAHVLVGLGEVDWACAGGPCTTPGRLARVSIESGTTELADVDSRGRWHATYIDRTGLLIPASPDTALVQMEDMTNGVISSIAVTFGKTVSYRTVLDDLGMALISDQRHDGKLLVMRESLKTTQRLDIVTAGLSSWQETTLYQSPVSRTGPLDVQVFSRRIADARGKPINVRTAVVGLSGRLAPTTPALVVVYPGQLHSSYARGFGEDYFGGVPVRYLVGLGYNLILVDLPMRPVSSGPSDLIKELRELMQPQIDLAAERGLVDPTRLGILGYSTGAYMAVAVTAQMNAFQVAIGINGITYDPASTFGMLSNGFWATQRLRLVDDPWTNPQRYDDNSPFRHADRIRAAIFLTYAGRDSAERIATSKMFLNALKHTGKAGYLVGYPDEMHGTPTWSPASRQDLLSRLSTFLQRYMPPSGPASSPTIEGRLRDQPFEASAPDHSAKTRDRRAPSRPLR